MNVQSIRGVKGSDVVTVQEGISLGDAASILRDKRVGALVVSNDGQHIDGIVSERDVVRALANHGASVLGRPVSSAMSKDVITCRAEDAVESLMVSMTERRIRHLPVVDDNGAFVVTIDSLGIPDVYTITAELADYTVLDVDTLTVE